MRRRRDGFGSIHSEGGLLPHDLLHRVVDPRAKVSGTKPEDYGLLSGDRINETITESWNRLRRHWREFRAAAQHLPDGEPGTGLTNDRWSLPLLRELGFGLLPTSPAPRVDGQTYAISRFLDATPIHLVGCGLSLDRRAAGVRGAASANPHGLVQQFLNRSPDHLWGLVTNGLRLRILRDNQALSRQSYLEFDLEMMFEGELYADFVLLWLMAHATRVVSHDGGGPDTCWLERWTKEAQEQGTRALGDLRQGVERALLLLGQGLVGHPHNTDLRESLRAGHLELEEFHAQLLRVVYRLIFLFVAEDRTLDGRPILHPRDDSEVAGKARERFAAHYSTARLRELAAKIKGTRHGDLWQQFNLLVGALSGQEEFAGVRQHLALATLGSLLWDPASTCYINANLLAGDGGAELGNADFLEAIRHLAFTRQDKVLRPVDYKNLGAEELGGVYESLLSLTPQISGDGSHFTFAEFAGNERKTSGSYYTPDSLVQNLLDSALDPVVKSAIEGKKGHEAEEAILSLKICDPAVGSGHFLVGAAHRLAQHLARVRAAAHGESEHSPAEYQQALRDVIGRCLYGVDINPMAAELCRVSLWLEALEPGKPLSFLDHHIRVGNSLLGATPELISAKIPDEAFTAIAGDDKRACTLLRRHNRRAREMKDELFAAPEAEDLQALQQAARAMEILPDESLDQVKAKEEALRALERTDEYRLKKLIADIWCGAFLIRKHFTTPGVDADAVGITQDLLRRVADRKVPRRDLALLDEAQRLAGQYKFFHWHLAFPDVYAGGGFDIVLGNPPWERVELQEKEWFAERAPSIANARNAAERKRRIEDLKAEDPEMHMAFLDAQRQAEGESHFLRSSGRYPLCGRGKINLYAIFAELMRTLPNDTGRMGAVLPTGIATD
ncbi:MAG: N-6 DNA methylase, partial [Bacillota bacterium]|nr:N-6 DNA methylase [Bacillota bacterium]